jgi:hypothetical protein
MFHISLDYVVYAQFGFQQDFNFTHVVESSFYKLPFMVIVCNSGHVCVCNLQMEEQYHGTNYIHCWVVFGWCFALSCFGQAGNVSTFALILSEGRSLTPICTNHAVRGQLSNNRHATDLISLLTLDLALFRKRLVCQSSSSSCTFRWTLCRALFHLPL